LQSAHSRSIEFRTVSAISGKLANNFLLGTNLQFRGKAGSI